MLDKRIKDPVSMKILFVSLVFPFAVLLKYFQFNYLPDKYFNYAIIGLVNSSEIIFNINSPDSFNNTAYLFQKINLMNFTTFIQWSLFITFFMSIYTMFYLSKTKLITLKDFISAIFVIALLNIYVFNPTKDIVQMIIFCIIFSVINRKKIPGIAKAAIIAVMFLIQSIFFRGYYILTACFFVFFYIAFESKIFTFKSNAFDIIKLVMFMLIILYVFLMVCEYIKPQELANLVGVRDGSTLHRIGNESAQTLIVNLFEHNGNIVLFLVNYLINSIRIMLPIELLLKGIYYYPFFFFQIICTQMILINISNYKKLNTVSRMSIYIMCAYYIVAFFFEPDFGSFVRHETATMPILMVLLLYDKNSSKRTKITRYLKSTAEQV